MEARKEWNSPEGGCQGTATDGRQAIGFQIEGPKVEIPVTITRSIVALGGDGAERVDQLRTSRIPNGIVVTTQIHLETMTGNVVVVVVQFGRIIPITHTLILHHVDAQDLWCSLRIPAAAANGEFEGRCRWMIVILLTPSTITVTITITITITLLVVVVVGIGDIPLAASSTFPEEELAHFVKDACGRNSGRAIRLALAVRCGHLTLTTPCSSTPGAGTGMEGRRGLDETSNERHRLLVSPTSHGGDGTGSTSRSLARIRLSLLARLESTTGMVLGFVTISLLLLVPFFQRAFKRCFFIYYYL